MGLRPKLGRSATFSNGVPVLRYVEPQISSIASTTPTHLPAETHGARPAPDLPCNEQQSSMMSCHQCLNRLALAPRLHSVWVLPSGMQAANEGSPGDEGLWLVQGEACPSQT